MTQIGISKTVNYLCCVLICISSSVKVTLSEDEVSVIDGTYLILNDLRDIKDNIILQKEGDTQHKVQTAKLLELLTVMLGKFEVYDTEVKVLMRKMMATLQTQQTQLNFLVQTLQQNGDTPFQKESVNDYSLQIEKTESNVILYNTCVGSMFKNNKIAISNPVGIHGYKFSDMRDQDRIIIFSEFNGDIRVFDSSMILRSRHRTKYAIGAMIELDRVGEYVIAHDPTSSLHLLDENFETVSTFTIGINKRIEEIRYLSKNSFIILETTNIPPYKVSIKTIILLNKTFAIQSVVKLQLDDKYPQSMIVSRDGHTVVILSSYNLHIVNLREKQYKRLWIGDYLKHSSTCLCRTGDTFLLGDITGRIYHFDKSARYIETFGHLKINSNVRDMTMRQCKLYVLSSDQNIHIFQ